MPSLIQTMLIGVSLLTSCIETHATADESQLKDRLIGYTELRTNFPGGRHANVRTMRAAVINGDGTGRRLVAEELADDVDAWTQFAGWSPDGRQAIVSHGWQDPENAKWEEEQRRFRMLPGKWQLDSNLVDPFTGNILNVTAVERVSHYNSVLFSPDGKRLLMTALINGVSKPFVMDLNGRNKRDVSGTGTGFTYGYSASPNGELISYHESYQVYIASADGSNRRHIATGNPFNFAPSWSADGQWLMFVSGVHGRSNPYVVHRDGTGLRKLADLNGYQGWVLFLDVPDFHQGSSDIPVWSADGRSVFYTAKSGESVELFNATLDGTITQLTRSPPGTLHYHITPSPDGRWLLYGSKRDGVRQLYVRDMATGLETRLTSFKPGYAGMWPHWRPQHAEVAEAGRQDLESGPAGPGSHRINGAEVYDHDPETSLGDDVFGNVICDFEVDAPGRNSHGGPVCMEYPDGSLVAFHSNTSDHNLDGWSEFAVSKDRGRTWKKYQKFAHCFEACRKTPQRSAWVQEGLVTNKGTGVVFVSHWENNKRVRIVFMKSHDYGSTWSDAEPVDGDFIGAPAAVAVSGVTNYVLFDCDGARGRHVLYASTDDGTSWQKRSTLPLEIPAWYGALCIMEDGALLAGAYITADEDHLHYCISHDGGRSWTRQNRARLDKKIRDPELAFIGGKYYLHGRSGHKGKGANRFVLYQSDDGVNWKCGLIVSAERGGYDGYSHNCVINRCAPDTPNELMIEYSVRYKGRDTNTYVFFVRPQPKSR